MSNKATPLVQRMIGEATMKYAFQEFQQATQLLLEEKQVPYRTRKVPLNNYAASPSAPWKEKSLLFRHFRVFSIR